MTAALDLFIEEARAVGVTEAAALLGIALSGRNHAGPCPACGGKDRFSINPKIQAWNCRGCGKGGRDGIGLMALAHGHDLAGAGFLLACSDALGGRPVPDEKAQETDEERRAREARLAERRAANERLAAKKERDANAFRDREIARARGIYLQAPRVAPMAVVEYLRLRTGHEMHSQVWENIRGLERCTYWHGTDERGNPAAFHEGPAMVAPFVNLDGRVIGCHQTWIDLGNNSGKFRPLLWTLTDEGRDAGCKPWPRPKSMRPPDQADIEAGYYQRLPTKKMRGAKKGGLIPLFGSMEAQRWLGGEGIENGLAIAAAEGWRADTFYFAAGDIGNLAGPRDPASDFYHPTLKKADRNGVERRVKVPGPVPAADQQADDAMPVGEHVTEVVLLGDGDSEPVWTASMMARAEARLARPGRVVTEWHAPRGADFADLMAGE